MWKINTLSIKSMFNWFNWYIYNEQWVHVPECWSWFFPTTLFTLVSRVAILPVSNWTSWCEDPWSFSALLSCWSCEIWSFCALISCFCALLSCWSCEIWTFINWICDWWTSISAILVFMVCISLWRDINWLESVWASPTSRRLLTSSAVNVVLQEPSRNNKSKRLDPILWKLGSIAGLSD